MPRYRIAVKMDFAEKDIDGDLTGKIGTVVNFYIDNQPNIEKAKRAALAFEFGLYPDAYNKRIESIEHKNAAWLWEKVQ